MILVGGAHDEVSSEPLPVSRDNDGLFEGKGGDDGGRVRGTEGLEGGPIE